MDQNTENTISPKPASSGVWERFSWLRNKYLIAGMLFLVWMLFFDPKDISSEINRWQKFKELQLSEQHLVKKISDTKVKDGELKNDVQTIEKYARENYLMKKDNEDLFIVNSVKSTK